MFRFRSTQPVLRMIVARRPAALACGGALAFGTAAAAAAAAAAPPPDASLGSLWAAALDGMIDVPGAEKLQSPQGVLYLASANAAPPPAEPKRGWFSKSNPEPERLEWPRLFSKGVVFSLTASNPMGADASPAYNAAANERLQKDIDEMKIEPRATWRSFGFNAQEGWREEGFSLAYAREERVYARQAVLKLAKKHRQAAVYYYSYEGDTVVREVIWVDARKHREHGVPGERLVVLREPPDTPLAAREWSPN